MSAPFRAIDDLFGQPRSADFGEKLFALIGAITCQDCGRRPAVRLSNNFSGATTRRTARCRECADRAEAHRRRAQIAEAEAAGDRRKVLMLRLAYLEGR